MENRLNIAKLYAKAAFQFARKNNSIIQWKDMLSISSQVIHCPKINSFFSSYFSKEKKVKIFSVILKKYQDKNYTNFIKILIYKNRISLLSKIFSYFKNFLNEYNEIIYIKVMCSNYLTKQQIKLLKLKMQKKFLKKIKLIFIIDTNLIAGLIFQIGDIIIDYSIKNRLTELENYLKNLREYNI